MSKTLVGILEVGALVAIQAIPGLGQVVGGAIASTIGIGTVTAETAIAIAQVAVIGVGTLANALIGNQATKPQQTEVPIKANPRSYSLLPASLDR